MSSLEQTKVLEIIQNKEGLSMADIAKTADISKRKAKDKIRKLKKAKKVIQLEDKYYKYTKDRAIKKLIKQKSKTIYTGYGQWSGVAHTLTSDMFYQNKYWNRYNPPNINIQYLADITGVNEETITAYEITGLHDEFIEFTEGEPYIPGDLQTYRRHRIDRQEYINYVQNREEPAYVDCHDPVLGYVVQRRRVQ